MKYKDYPLRTEYHSHRAGTLAHGAVVYLCRSRTSKSATAGYEGPNRTVYVFASNEDRAKYIGSKASADQLAIGYISASDHFPIEVRNRAWFVNNNTIRSPKDYSPDQPMKYCSQWNSSRPEADPQPCTQPEPEKEKPIMSTTKTLITTAVTKNKAAATSAAFMEAGRIANNQLAKVASKKLPLMVRGYAETPAGKLVIANVAVLAAAHFRPEDQKLGTLAQAMAVQAYQELIQTMDIEGVLDDLLENKDIKRALAKLGGEKTEQE